MSKLMASLRGWGVQAWARCVKEIPIRVSIEGQLSMWTETVRSGEAVADESGELFVRSK